jgi:hypothetical protein
MAEHGKPNNSFNGKINGKNNGKHEHGVGTIAVAFPKQVAQVRHVEVAT